LTSENQSIKSKDPQVGKERARERQGGNIRRRFWPGRLGSFDVAVVLVAILVVVVVTLIRFKRDGDSIYIFKGIVGPREVTRIPKLDPTPWSRYAPGTASRLAVLLTD